jgi:hypothetical protein
VRQERQVQFARRRAGARAGASSDSNSALRRTQVDAGDAWRLTCFADFDLDQAPRAQFPRHRKPSTLNFDGVMIHDDSLLHRRAPATSAKRKPACIRDGARTPSPLQARRVPASERAQPVPVAANRASLRSAQAWSVRRAGRLSFATGKLRSARAQVAQRLVNPKVPRAKQLGGGPPWRG